MDFYPRICYNIISMSLLSKSIDTVSCCWGDSSDLINYSNSCYSDLPFRKSISFRAKHHFSNFDFINEVIVNIDAFSSDYILLIDEDCFICDTNALVSLINYQIKNDIHVSGMPDGGVPCRCHNPIGINPFLSFLNLKEIRKVYDVDSVKSTEYCESLNKFLPQDLMKDGYPWELDNFEDYYKIWFFLLKKGFNIKYLDAYFYHDIFDDLTDDEHSTILNNQENKPVAFHSWYGRRYFCSDFHKNRITNLYNKAKDYNKTCHLSSDGRAPHL